jgi:two-component system NtrC family sensor kinase
MCDASFGILWTYDGECFHAAALRNVPAPYAEFLTRAPYQPEPEGAHGRIVNGESFIRITDVADTELYRSGDPFRRALVDLGGARSGIAVALRKDDTLLGMFIIYRQEVRPFSNKQIALLQNFAMQAVIAMENARLLTETREALEQQTATAEVLQVINSSPGELQPVFEAILEKAHTHCGATRGALMLFDGETFRGIAMHGYPQDRAEQLRRGFSVRESPLAARLLAGDRFVHIADVRLIDAQEERAAAERGGVRTCLLLALRKDGALLGMISCNRGEVRPFSAKEIAFLENFAVQAVIAMENARLLGELQARTRDLEESLEYQTATSDVLNVISRSTADVQPVLDTVIETAARLCAADDAAITIREGEVYRFVASSYSAADPERWAAVRQRTIVPGRDNIAARVALEGRVVHVEDFAADPDFALPETVKAGIRTALGVPLLREGTVLGTISLGRKRVEPFNERQIELVRTFADKKYPARPPKAESPPAR